MASTTKEVRVVINGEEYVSTAAKKAEGGMDGFMAKIPGWAKAVAVATAAYAVLSKAIASVKDFVLDSFDAYDRYTAAQTKLSAQSKLTGVSLKELKETAKRARDEFGLSNVTANDAATTVAKYASRAGDAALKNELLAAALDLGAASGLDAAESMAALEMGLRGQDEGFDKLLGKNPSTLWKEYADANDLAVGKMTDAQKRMAELTAVVDAGNMVQGSYNERLKSGAGQQDLLNNKMDNAKAAFGAALQPIRLVVIEGLSALVSILTPVVVGLAKLVNFVSVSVIGVFVEFRSSVGSVVEGIGKLTGNKKLEEWGARNASVFREYIAKVSQSADATDDMGESATKAGNKHQLATVQITASAKKNADETDASVTRMNAIIDTKLGPPLKNLVGITEGAIRSLADAANDQLPPEAAAKFDEHMQSLVEHSKQVAEEIERVPPPVERSAKETQKMVSDVADIARTALDAAGAFGVIDDKAASALNSAINIASSLSKLAGGDFAAGLSGIVAGIGNIVSIMINGDPERRRLLRDNNTQLEKLRREGVHLSTSASGETISKAKGLFAPGFADMLAGIAKGGGNAMNPLLQGLLGAGLTVSDLDSIAKDLGINIRNKDGGIDFAALQQLVIGLQTPGFGSRIDNSFGSQLDFFRDSQKLSGASGVGEISDLVTYLRNVGGVSALEGVDFSDPNAARNKLFEIFTSLNNQSLDASTLGELTGDQFRDLLFEMIQGLTGGNDVTGGPVVDIGGGGGGTGEVVDIPGVGPVSLSTGQIVTDALEAQTAAMGPMLEAANTFHARTADATEGTFATLLRIEAFMQSFDLTGTVNARLEAIRQAEAAYRGEGLRF